MHLLLKFIALLSCLIAILILILILLNFFSNIFSGNGFSSKEKAFSQLFLPSILIPFPTIVILNILKINDVNLILPCLILFHLISYIYSYAILFGIVIFISYTESKLLTHKYIGKLFKLIGISTNYILHPSFNFSLIPIYQNTKLLKLLLVLSYLLSILIFKFYIEIDLVNIFINYKESITTGIKIYTDVFMFSIIPIIYSYLKK